VDLPADTTIHPLPAQRAFLVQVHAQAEVAQGCLAGRVEHVVSGQATHFASPEELLAFMACVLTPLHPPHAEEKAHDAPHAGWAARGEAGLSAQDDGTST
jgi:hypothetical protein